MNRESQGKFPEPRRDINNHRWYTLEDILHLQLISFGEIRPKNIANLLYSKGLTDRDELKKVIDASIEQFVRSGIEETERAQDDD